MWISQLDEVAFYWFVACLYWVRKTFGEPQSVISVAKGSTPQKEWKKLLGCRKVFFWIYSTVRNLMKLVSNSDSYELGPFASFWRGRFSNKTFQRLKSFVSIFHGSCNTSIRSWGKETFQLVESFFRDPIVKRFLSE